MAWMGAGPSVGRAEGQGPGRSAATVQARVRALTRACGLAGVAIALTGLAVMTGWAFGVDALTRIAPGLVSMKFTTATCFFATGVAISGTAAALLTGGTRWARVATVAVALVSVIAVLTLVEDAVGFTLALDNPFGFDPGDANTPVPGRMAQMTAVSLLGLSGAIVLTIHHRVRTAQALAIGVISVGMMALVGYAYGVRSLYTVGPFNTMAVHTATAALVAGTAVLFLRSGEGYASVVVGDTAGGVIMRRLLPWVVLVPNLVGGIVVVGLRHDVLDGPVALAMLVTSVSTAGAALVWFQAEHLRDVDLRREDAEDALAIAEAALAERDRVQHALALSERRTRGILSAAADAYVAIDEVGRVTDWNDAATTMFGWSRDEALGVFLDKLIIPPGEAAAHRAGIARYLRSGASPVIGTQREFEALTRSGARMPVELTVWADVDPTGRGFHGFLRDITSRKQFEQELRSANADLKEFAAVAAHDLRAPLSTIQMQVEVLLGEEADDPNDPDIAERIARIGRTAERGVALIDDLLNYVSVGRHTPASRPVDLSALARDVADQQIAAHGRPATCVVEPLPVVVGDEPLLAQLLGNLIGNALKYVPNDRTPRVVVDAVVGRTPGRCVVRVTDNGDGFRTDEHERVFDMFQRGSGAAGVPGTGIGLAICRRVVERHGGRIWIEEGPEGGSRVCVQLIRWARSRPAAETVAATIV